MTDTTTIDSTIPDPIDEPWKVIGMALVCQAKDVEMSKELSDAVYDAATFLACGTLIQTGMDVEKAVRQFEERDFEIHLSYDRTTDEMGLTIEWADGETTLEVRSEIG